MAGTYYIYKKHPPEKVKSIILENVSKTINRKVDLGGIKVGFVKGITIEEISIFEKDAKEKFIYIKSINARPSILSIFTGKLHISRIAIITPSIRVVSRKGIYNFSDMLMPAKEPATLEKEKHLDIPIYINNVEVKNGIANIDYEGQVVKVKNLNINSKAISLKGAFPLKADFVVETIYNKKPIAVNFELDSILSQRFVELKKFKVFKESFLFTTKGTLKQTELNISGNIIDLNPELFNIVLPIKLISNLNFEVSATTTEIKSLQVKADIRPSGKINELEVGGIINVIAQANGLIKDLDSQVFIELKNFIVKSQNFKKDKGSVLNAKINSKLKNLNDLTLQLEYNILGIKASGVSRVSNIVSNRQFVDASIKIEPFPLKTIREFLPFEIEGFVKGTYAKIKGFVPAFSYSFETIIEDLRLKLENIHIEKTRAKIALKDDELNIDSRGLFNSENFAITIKAMDFNTPYFDINAKFDNFNLDPFIVINPQAGAQKKQEVSDKPEFTSKGEVLFKKITQKLYEGNEANMKWSFRGAGNNIRKLNGSFSFNMKNGTIKASELTKNLKKLYNPEKPDIGYKSMSLNGSAQNGVMSLNGVINGEDEVDIYFKGYANMGDGAIDFDIKLTMPAERVPENLKAYLGNENRLDLELKLTGSIERPQYIITSKVIEKVIEKKVEQKKEEIKEQIQKEAEKKLREIFKLGQ